MEAMAKEMQQQAKEMRAAHAAELTQLRGDERAARVVVEDQLLRVQCENTELERKLRAAQHRLRVQQGEAAKADEEATGRTQAAEAELARVRDHGRAWSKVREAEAHIASLESSCNALRDR
eukprot:5987868-Prymnesium_polylepis.1